MQNACIPVWGQGRHMVRTLLLSLVLSCRIDLDGVRESVIEFKRKRRLTFNVFVDTGSDIIEGMAVVDTAGYSPWF
ncbi:hypothetical protein DE146DRAFT_664991 [Phaeosphaeria sp. MPI-PUGE-AT-0046c]|nr:hypothetical protein DE146DRAFT_664991 [Phaeosphaeria sp. MPI-PUGE-AT-0046c]